MSDSFRLAVKYPTQLAPPVTVPSPMHQVSYNGAILNLSLEGLALPSAGFPIGFPTDGCSPSVWNLVVVYEFPLQKELAPPFLFVYFFFGLSPPKRKRNPIIQSKEICRTRVLSWDSLQRCRQRCPSEESERNRCLYTGGSS